jgi:site-specific recombinase XerD
LFPARDQRTPFPATTRQKTFTRVVRQSGMGKDAAIPTVRHASATQLRERGVSLRVMQERRGHHRPRTTARSAHLTPPTLDVGHATIAALMAAL